MNPMLPNPEQAVKIYTIPDQIRNQLDEWSKNGKPPNELLGSILSNNLFQSMIGMDKLTGKHLEEVIQYINQELHPECWGSVEKMKSWFVFKKNGEQTPLAMVQIQEGMDTKRQVRALQAALFFSNTVVEEILKTASTEVLENINRKANAALNGSYEESLSIKVGK